VCKPAPASSNRNEPQDFEGGLCVKSGHVPGLRTGCMEILHEENVVRPLQENVPGSWEMHASQDRSSIAAPRRMTPPPRTNDSEPAGAELVLQLLQTLVLSSKAAAEMVGRPTRDSQPVIARMVPTTSCLQSMLLPQQRDTACTSTDPASFEATVASARAYSGFLELPWVTKLTHPHLEATFTTSVTLPRMVSPMGFSLPMISRTGMSYNGCDPSATKVAPKVLQSQQ
jgi:hypothetical protein